MEERGCISHVWVMTGDHKLSLFARAIQVFCLLVWMRVRIAEEADAI